MFVNAISPRFLHGTMSSHIFQLCLIVIPAVSGRLLHNVCIMFQKSISSIWHLLTHLHCFHPEMLSEQKSKLHYTPDMISLLQNEYSLEFCRLSYRRITRIHRTHSVSTRWPLVVYQMLVSVFSASGVGVVMMLLLSSLLLLPMWTLERGKVLLLQLFACAVARGSVPLRRVDPWWNRLWWWWRGEEPFAVCSSCRCLQ